MTGGLPEIRDSGESATCFPRAMSAYQDLMVGNGLTADDLRNLGPLAIFLAAPTGWRPDALYVLRRFLSSVLHSFEGKGRHEAFRQPTPAVAAVLRAVIGLDHYPVPKDWARLLARQPTAESTVRTWERQIGTVMAAEVERLRAEAWQAAGCASLPLPGGPYPYWTGTAAGWPTVKQTALAVRRVRKALQPLVREGLPAPSDAEILTLLRESVSERAERYLDLTQPPVPGPVRRERGIEPAVEGRGSSTAALRAHSYLHYKISPAWSDKGRLWLLSGYGATHLGNPSDYRGGGKRFREAADAALSQELFRFIGSDELMKEFVFYATRQLLDNGSPQSISKRPTHLVMSHARVQRTLATLVDRSRPPRAVLARGVVPRGGDGVLRTQDEINVDDLVKDALHIRTQRSSREKVAFIEGYLRKRAELPDPRRLNAADREAVALADHYVEWDAVCASSIERAEQQLHELHRMVSLQPLPEHGGYATHHFRGMAVMANKKADRRAALHHAMDGVLRLSELRAQGLAGSPLEQIESAHQHALGIAGIWAKQLEGALCNPRRGSGTPAWVLARRASAWANEALRNLELLDDRFVLPEPVAEDVRWKERRISTTRWRVQTRLIHARVHIACHIAWKAGLGSRNDFTDMSSSTIGPPIDLDSMDLTALSYGYHHILELKEVTEAADGPRITQLALALGFLSGGGLPTLRLEDLTPAKRTGLQKPLDFLFTDTTDLDSTPTTYGLPRVELRAEAASQYLRRRGFDALTLSKLPDPQGSAVDPYSPGARAYRLLAERNAGVFEPWHQAWSMP